MNRQALSKNAGFTLVELLIVIAIIGVLMGVVTLNVINGIPIARDGSRASDINAVENALAQYFSNTKEYPQGASCTANAYCVEISTAADFLKTELVTGDYMRNTIEDPLNDATYHYEYGNVADGSANPDLSTYYIHALLEQREEGENIFAKCNGAGGVSGYYYMKFSDYSTMVDVTSFDTCPVNCSSVCYKKTW